jgi:hypothetical protein
MVDFMVGYLLGVSLCKGGCMSKAALAAFQKEPTWEEECQVRIRIWQAALKGLAAERDVGALHALKAAVDAQMAIAELKLKVRQADWAKTMTWGPLILPTLGAIFGAFIGGWLHGQH